MRTDTASWCLDTARIIYVHCQHLLDSAACPTMSIKPHSYVLYARKMKLITEFCKRTDLEEIKIDNKKLKL